MEKLQDIELKKILTELADMLQKVYQEKLKAVILYGSVARGTATDESDIDIMVLARACWRRSAGGRRDCVDGRSAGILGPAGRIRRGCRRPIPRSCLPM